MALNPDHFIFHSNLLFEQRIKTTTGITVATSGTIAAAGQATWSSPWQTLQKSGSTVRGKVYVPGTVYYPNVTNATFPLPTARNYNTTYNLMFDARIELQNTQFRCVVYCNNPYDFAIPSPSRTFTFSVSEYMPAIST